MAAPEKSYEKHKKELRDQGLRKRLFIIIFGTDTPAGKAFDVILLILIFLSVAAVMMETVGFIADDYQSELRISEWIFTAFFSLEYLARVWVVKKPSRYIFSFLGIIDLLAILPSFLSLVVAGSQGLLIIRALRLLRIFRVLKMVRFVSESEVLGRALKAARHKIFVFFFFLIILVFILGSVMYLVEGPDRGFTSIPLSIYWAIVTLTTVGFGDITPQTFAGQLIASIVMLLGYAIIAIPTGIVGAEIYKGDKDVLPKHPNLRCEHCGNPEHSAEARYCSRCGKKVDFKLPPEHETPD